MIKQELNILQIINEPWTSGITEYGLILSRGLKEKGHNIIIAGLEGTPVEEGAKKTGIKYEIIDGINSLNPSDICNSIKALNSIIKRENINVINTHRAEGQPLGYLSNKMTGGKAALIRTRGDQRVTKNNIFNRYLYRRLTDRIIVASLMAKEDHFRDFNIAGKIRIIPPAVDTGMFNPCISGEKFRAKYGIKNNEYLVGIIGRLDPVKGHYYFIEAAGRLKDILPSVKYAVVGREENIKLNELRRTAASFGLEDKMFFTGFYENIPEAAAAFDIGVIASIGSEAISRVCLEMMACGKPVIASRVGSIQEMVLDGKTGLLYGTKDSIQLSEHIKSLVLNPGLAGEMGINARSRVMNVYSVDNLVRNTENVYFEALEEKWKKLQ